ncbi:hypothetical protein VP01_689g2 [Puccinia sorghi]|uniref:Uncharacterized protein n=1 Tax=Puccinia sorghi TaxID=27349 RepID=A0A0L6UE92_9BASI|nr:hypothetical protein VP01_689g2 [Puccinia sorghi]
MPEPSLSITSPSLPGKNDDWKPNLTVYSTNSYPFWLGGLAASMAAICTHPLDVAKVRMQTGPTRSMLRTLISAVQLEGLWKGAYVGLSASLARQMTYSMTRFGVYDDLKLALARHSGNPDTTKLPCHHLAIAASLAGAAGGLAGNPADVILVRMTSDINRPIDERKGYKNWSVILSMYSLIFEAFFRMIREEGFGSLTRGLGPNLSRSILMNASQLATYDSIKGCLLNTKFFHEGLWLHFCASSMAVSFKSNDEISLPQPSYLFPLFRSAQPKFLGSKKSPRSATTICSPFDVVKSRVNHEYHSWKCHGASGDSTVVQERRSRVDIPGMDTCFHTTGTQHSVHFLPPCHLCRLLGQMIDAIIIFIGLEQLKIATDFIKNR